MTLGEIYDAAAAAYRDDPTEENREAYEAARDELVESRRAEREGRESVTLIAEEN